MLGKFYRLIFFGVLRVSISQKYNVCRVTKVSAVLYNLHKTDQVAEKFMAEIYRYSSKNIIYTSYLLFKTKNV